MADTTTPADETSDAVAPAAPRRRRAASRPAGPPPAAPADAEVTASEGPASEAPAVKETKAKESKAKAKEPKEPKAPAEAPAADATAAKATAKRTSRRAAGAAVEEQGADSAPAEPKPAAKRSRSRKAVAEPAAEPEALDAEGADDAEAAAAIAVAAVLFQAPEPEAAPKRTRSRKAAPAPEVVEDEEAADEDAAEAVDEEGAQDATESADEEGAAAPRRRRRGGRRRRRGGSGEGEDAAEDSEDAADDAEDAEDGEGGDSASSRRRRRRRRRGGSGDDGSSDDPPNTVTRVRAPRDEVTAVRGSTRLEAKKQRRRDGREAGRRRAPILSEAEFLARREDVERVMVVRERDGRTQIAVLEDGVLVEHYVDRGSSGSMVGNVYLGRVQNVLPSMEAAFVDIGRGRNAVLYAGEVNWDAAGLDGQPKRIEFALKSGDPVLVQVTKDPMGHKGARLTSQISLPGRYLVYVPGGGMTGISRKLPDTERSRLKRVLKEVVPEDSGVIVRTAAEGASEEELRGDVSRLTAQWEDIDAKSKTAAPPTLLYGEPDLSIRVVRDIFNEDFAQLVVSGPEAWETLEPYVTYVAPDLAGRLQKYVDAEDVFTKYRVDEQLAKALDRKVWLPSGGSLVIDRTEAMTVVDVNTGKFTGQGGNLEETVTRNNLEAAEEIVRQLRLRDIGGIIVVDFIDMVLESNRDAVLRRLVECLGRDRTKHQVAEITSLGLVQMTRKRIGQGLLETFSESCEHCNGRGVKVQLAPVETGSAAPSTSGKAARKGKADPAEAAARSSRGRRSKGAADAEAPADEVVEAGEAPEVAEVSDAPEEAATEAV